jgi:Laminin B (Domain IV)
MNLSRLLTIAGLAVATMPAFAAISSFDSGAEGWSAQGDVEGTIQWSSTGGNPGGHILIDDQTTGGVTYFIAPAAFRGNQSGALGTNLTFDLKQVYPGGANQFDSPDVILQGNGLTVAFNTAMNPANGAWTSYAVPLSASGWMLNSLSGSPVTVAQFASVMSNVTALKVRAEYQTGADVGYLDNVSMVPEPQNWAMLLAGLCSIGMAARRVRNGR